MGDRIKADIESLVKLQEERADLLQRLRAKIDTLAEVTEELSGTVPEPDRSLWRRQAEDALGTLTDGWRELKELFYFEEHAAREYREAEAEAGALMEDLL